MGTQVVKIDPQSERGTRIVDINLPPMVKKARQSMARPTPGGHGQTFRKKRGALELDESEVSRGMDEFAASMKLFYKRLHRFDRWTVWVLALGFIGAFLPWRYELGTGLIAGIQGLYGILCAVMSVVTLGVIYLRTARRRLAGVMLLVQVLTSTLLASIPLYRYFSSEVLTFKYGIGISAVASLLVVALTLARLTRINV